MGLFKLKKEEKDSNSIKEAVGPLKSEAELRASQNAVNPNSNIGSPNLNPSFPNPQNSLNTLSSGSINQSFSSSAQQQVPSFSSGIPPQNNSLSSAAPQQGFLNQQEINAQSVPSQLTPNSFPQDSLNSMEAPLTKNEVQEMIEETIERVIDEELHKLTSSVKKVIVWKEKVENEIAALKEDILNLKDGFDRLEKRVLGKINDYDKNILDVSSEIKALEKVFQKITPKLVNNVNELSRIAKMLKESVPKKDED